MCGIVGLFLKDPALEPRLGALLTGMLATMSDRGPDSAGFAVYGAGSAGVKLTLRGPDAAALAEAVAALDGSLDLGAAATARDTHTVLEVPLAREAEIRAWLARNRPSIDVVGAGRRMEIYKEVGLPAEVAARFDLAGMRAATASATPAWPPRAPSPRTGPTRSRPAPTSASSTTARSRTTTTCAAACNARGSPSPPATIPRSPPAT
jgi:hypothetical protein